MFLSHICLLPIAVGTGRNQAVENKCHRFGWYLGCRLLLKNAVFPIVAPLLMEAPQSTEVTLVDVVTSTQLWKVSQSCVGIS